MGFLHVFATVFLLSHNVIAVKEVNITSAFTDSNIIPDVIWEAPQDMLHVRYATVEVCLGDEIQPYQAILPPKLEYDYKPDVNYTLIFLNPDLPSSPAPAIRSVIYWMVVNIPGDKLDAGYSVLTYVPAISYPGSGYQRFVYLLYAQNKVLDVTDPSLLRYGVEVFRFSVTKFAKQFDLGPLVAANYFISRVPSMTTEFYCKA